MVFHAFRFSGHTFAVVQDLHVLLQHEGFKLVNAVVKDEPTLTLLLAQKVYDFGVLRAYAEPDQPFRWRIALVFFGTALFPFVKKGHFGFPFQGFPYESSAFELGQFLDKNPAGGVGAKGAGGRRGKECTNERCCGSKSAYFHGQQPSARSLRCNNFSVAPWDPGVVKLAMLRFDFSHFSPRRGDLQGAATEARQKLESGSGPGSEFRGWMDLPEKAGPELPRIREVASRLRQRDAVVIIGIGGSYLGARAVIEALRDPFGVDLPIFFAGHQLDGQYHEQLLRHLGTRDYGVIVISKSGTTTEPALAFRWLLADLEARFGEAGVRERVVAVTDARKGSLRSLADRNGLDTFVIPDNVGGRFSVLSPVGLLPIAVAGLDVEGLMSGAAAMQALVRGKEGDNPETSPALAYVCARNAAYRAGKKIEILASYRSGLHFTGEWWKQLYGESEGKDGKGIFPASVDLTTDLHSMGQWLQEGERTIFETIIDVEDSPAPVVPKDARDEDGLNYLAGRTLNDVNRVALMATMEAHVSGGVPCSRLILPRIDAPTIGALLYMFQYACGISGYLLGVNPFDQPGVEAYKTNMFRMLGKPGT